MNLLTSIGTGFNTVKNTCNVHSPEIFMTVGVVSIIAGTVLTIKNATKAADILEERKQAIDDLEELQLESPEHYPPATLESDIKKVNLNTTVGIVKTYAPGVMLTTAGIASMIFANHIISARYKAALTAYSGLSGAFAAYRQRVNEIFGDDADDKVMYGTEKKKLEVTEVDPETGEVKTKKQEVTVATNPYGVSQYARYFDDGETTEWVNNMMTNEGYIIGVEAQANDLLKYKGKNKVVTLNEVYHMLGFEPSEDGAQVGWCFDGEHDDRIIFKVLEVARPDTDMFGNELETYHKCFLIDFNVDGPVINKFPKTKFIA